MHLLRVFGVFSVFLVALASPAAVYPRQLDVPLLPSGDLSDSKILDQIITRFSLDATLALSFPGLLGEFRRLKKGESTVDSLGRAYLNSVKSRNAFKKAFAALDEGLQEQVLDFMAGQSSTSVVRKRGFNTPLSPPAMEHFKKMEESPSVRKRAWLNAKRQTSPAIYEDGAKKKLMQASSLHLCGSTFSNIGSGLCRD